MLHCDLTLDARRRRDPTGTADVRSRLSSDLRRRWDQVRRLASQMLVEQDALGIRTPTPQSVVHDPVLTFQTWIDGAMSRVVFGTDGSWMGPYVDETVARARARAHRLAGFGAVAENWTDVRTAKSGATAELQGVMEVVSQQTVRAVKNGLLRRHAPRAIMADVQMSIVRVGVVRSRALAYTTVVEVFNHASLDAFAGLGVRRVGVEPEYVRRAPVTLQFATDRRGRKQQHPSVVEVLTAGDDDVCDECEEISVSGPYEIDEARSLIPAHPNCRCAFVPFEDERFSEIERT